MIKKLKEVEVRTGSKTVRINNASTHLTFTFMNENEEEESFSVRFPNNASLVGIARIFSNIAEWARGESGL